MNCRRIFLYYLPPHLKSVAALPCEIWMFNCTTLHRSYSLFKSVTNLLFTVNIYRNVIFWIIWLCQLYYIMCPACPPSASPASCTPLRKLMRQWYLGAQCNYCAHMTSFRWRQMTFGIQTRKPCCRKETARCRSCSFRLKAWRQHSPHVCNGQGRWFWHQSKARMRLPTFLVINSNLGLPRFRIRDIAGFLRRATPPLFHPNFWGVSLGLDYRCCGSEQRRP